MLKDKDASQGFNLKKKKKKKKGRTTFFNESIFPSFVAILPFCHMFGREKWYFTLNEGIAKEVKEIRNRCHSLA